ncbi:hypothetical protein COOONC_25300 [Cooperia oncophora]
MRIQFGSSSVFYKSERRDKTPTYAGVVLCIKGVQRSFKFTLPLMPQLTTNKQFLDRSSNTTLKSTATLVMISGDLMQLLDILSIKNPHVWEKMERRSPDGSYRGEMDHVLCPNLSFVVTVLHGYDVGSDHRIGQLPLVLSM